MKQELLRRQEERRSGEAAKQRVVAVIGHSGYRKGQDEATRRGYRGLARDMKADYLQVPSKKWANWSQPQKERVNAYFIMRMEEKAAKNGGYYVHATPLHPKEAQNKNSLYRQEIRTWIYKNEKVK